MIQRHGLRSLVADGKSIECIRFYDANGVWLTTQQGWLEHRPIWEPEYKPRFDITSLDVDPVRRLKENFTRKEAYVIEVKGVFSWKPYARITCLYIYMPRVEPTIVLDWQDDTKRSYDQRFVLPISGTYDEPSMDPDTDKVTYTPTKVGQIVITRYSHDQNTEVGAHAEQIAAAMNAALDTKHKTIDARDVIKLLTKLNITIK